MQSIDHYFLDVRSKITDLSFIESENIVFEKFGQNIGKIHGKILFRNLSLLEFLEMICISERRFERPRYRFHWQDTKSKLIIRWDNAKHHPEISSYPHHKHILSEEKIEPSESVGIKDVLEFISRRIGKDINE